MTKNNFFVLTGGPGGGKTSLLQALKERGINFIPETARAIIQNRLRAGLPPRPAPREFALEIFERDWENYAGNISVTDPLFFDRSFLDSAAMIHEADLEMYAAIREVVDRNRFNNKVFITPPWEAIYQADSERDQTWEEAVHVYQRLYTWYEDQGYDLVVLPKGSIEQRVEFVLHESNS